MQYSPRRTSLNARQAHKLAVLLKQQRLSARLSIGRLAERSGVNVATIFKLEKAANSAPQPETLRALGDALGVSSFDIFTACEWITVDELPGLGAYLRTKYRDLSEAEISELQDQLHQLTRDRKPQGPRHNEDEVN